MVDIPSKVSQIPSWRREKGTRQMVLDRRYIL